MRATLTPVETEPNVEGTSDTGHHAAKSFLRGSSLLLVGRVLAIGVNFLVQVLAVRYLAKSDYGAFAWAQAIAAMGAQVVLLGLNRGVAQFAAMYHERREYGAMFGALTLALGTVLGLGLFVVALVLGLHGLLAGHVESEVAVGLLLLLIGLVPIDALDALFETALAVFARARAIFFRRYVLAPGLKLAAVALVIWVEGSVQLLAAAYLISGALGIVLYVLLLWRLLAQQDLLVHLRPRSMSFPARSLFGFSLPLLTTDLLLAVETPMVVIFLEHFRSTLEVADLRVAAQVAALCLLVFQNSKILFRPQAARLFARGDDAALGDLYWQSAAWMTIVTFPIFAVCLFLAGPITVLVFGSEYAGAGVLLAILAVGKYFNAAMGMNTFTLQVHARVGLIVLINVLSGLLGVGLCLLLIPRFGAVGGALATAATIVIRNLAYQIGLIATTRVGIAPPPARRVYASVLVAVALLAALGTLCDSALLLLPAVTLASLALPWFNRRYLNAVETFPELAKIPLARRFLGVPAS